MIHFDIFSIEYTAYFHWKRFLVPSEKLLKIGLILRGLSSNFLLVFLYDCLKVFTNKQTIYSGPLTFSLFLIEYCLDIEKFFCFSPKHINTHGSSNSEWQVIYINVYADCHSGRGKLFSPSPQKPRIFKYLIELKSITQKIFFVYLSTSPFIYIYVHIYSNMISNNFQFEAKPLNWYWFDILWKYIYGLRYWRSKYKYHIQFYRLNSLKKMPKYFIWSIFSTYF